MTQRKQLTGTTQKAGFSFPGTVLRLIKHWVFKSGFVVKVASIG
jgi:hypothetical protein